METEASSLDARFDALDQFLMQHPGERHERGRPLAPVSGRCVAKRRSILQPEQMMGFHERFLERGKPPAIACGGRAAFVARTVR